jgi:hypothetical protein
MLIALFTILILGGGDTGMLDFIADTQDEVKLVMDKDDRQKEALATLKTMKKLTDGHNKMVKGASKDLRSTLSTDDGTDAEIDLVWDAYFSQRAAYNQEMLGLRFQLKDQLTREEWAAIFDPPEDDES